MRLGVAEVLAEAWTLYTRNLPRLVATAVVVFGPLALVDAAANSLGSARRLLILVSILVTILGLFWLQGALALAVQDLRGGRADFSIADAFRRVGPHLGRLVLAGLMAGVGIAAGLLLYVVPGVVLLTYWSLVTPAVVLEGRDPLAAFWRSMQLVGRNGMRVFVVIAVTIVLATVVYLVVVALLQPLPAFVGTYIAGVLANSVTVPYVALAWTVMYYDLRAAGSEPRRTVGGPPTR